MPKIGWQVFLFFLCVFTCFAIFESKRWEMKDKIWKKMVKSHHKKNIQCWWEFYFQSIRIEWKNIFFSSLKKFLQKHFLRVKDPYWMIRDWNCSSFFFLYSMLLAAIVIVCMKCDWTPMVGEKDEKWRVSESNNLRLSTANVSFKCNFSNCFLRRCWMVVELRLNEKMNVERNFVKQIIKVLIWTL